MTTSANGPAANVDPAEVERFSRLADEWWNPRGKFRPLHQIAPARLSFIRDALAGAFERDPGKAHPLAGLRVLDIGCGGGLISEPLCRLGAEVVGIDPAGSGIEAARVHARKVGLEIDYRNVTAESLVSAGESFDAVLCLEVIEHVPDVPAMVRHCAALTRPGGVLVFSTINRTLKAFALAIVGAEYVLRWLPRGTHHYEKLVKPEELRRAIEAAGAAVTSERGMTYDPLRDVWSLSGDLDVNYLMAARRS
ncbi:MAG: bifunctional 2-polyprenyl-6-hydroxyphenol methylase/3-demethylubiquinol 3-O-methyltransferase UbiG [Rhizobiales bacterium]|nr:bifunctional 2-polyprenyl-6-hydroxyphenol methylase/3-demethylubiquinol 3-O-methyltransferase UbiG [Hyphomicrobiales bacterium]